ncbi:tetratricopeptide repeat protein 25-like [Hyposmocoma kahamanoa]|uniref:tetratricopeptide repeat protein 25-like n=1 Tax=Hyposmocoma kahamanoa TaxID=1477025 RepID=UPI000E6D7569|nr:tetratricopeptide repeat protein 25-like [Hyposmocoma kahamanoa]
MEPKPIFSALTVYRERGAFLRRLEQFQKAKCAYDTAFKTNPENVLLLVGRSKVCSDAVQPIQAYDDAELALKLEPNNMVAQHMQALAMFTIGDFERSLVMNYRGVRHRQKPPYFHEGINQGIETLQDCVGKNAGNVLIDFLPLIKDNQTVSFDMYEPIVIPHKSRIPRPEAINKLTQLEIRKHEQLERVLAMKYLGQMAYDKFYLQALRDHPVVMSANAAGSRDIKNIIIETIHTLSERQEMLRCQRPYYSIKLAEKSKSQHQDMFQKKLLENERITGARTADLYLKQMDNCWRTNNLALLIAKAERMQLFLDGKTPHTLPDKELYTDRLYRTIGEGYLLQYRLSYNMSDRGNKRRVFYLMGLPVSRPSSYDSVIMNYPHKYLSSKLALEKYMNTLEKCENTMMRCWLMYEVARLLAIQKNYALSKYYAKLCQREATEINNATWWLNGCFVLLSGDMQQGNVNEVRNQVEEAYEWTKLLQSGERIQAFLGKCAAMAEEALIGDERKAIVQREKDIMRVLDANLKVETEVLFKRLATVPVGRRFSVLPGKIRFGFHQTERRKRRQKGLSIIPGQPQTLPKPPISDTLGLQIFES